jgi:hypothetical protein
MLSETIRATAPLHICGIQSNDEDLDSSYASSMFYDAKSHRVFVTGATYGRYFDPGAMYSDDDDTTDCFVGILQLPMREEQNDPVWLRRVTIGEPNVSEACSDIATGGQDTSKAIYLAGHTEKSPGILASLYPDLVNDDPSTSPAVYGMILDLTWSANLKGGRLMYADAVQYPVAITSDSGMDDIFVATSTANTTAIDPAFSMWAEQQNITQMDYTTAGGYLPPYYERGFAASVQKINTISDGSNIRQVMGAGGPYSLQENLKAAWDLQVGQDGAPDGFSVHISSLLHVSDKVLVLAGSTRGAGPSFGGIDDDLSMNGFLTVLDPGTGDVVQSKRVQSSESSVDRILGLCRSNHNSSNYDIFVVGMTDGNMYSDGQTPASTVQPGVYQAFIQKVNIVSLEVLWTYQLGAYLEEDEALSDSLPHIHGMGCAVTPDGEQVYLAGTAENGATVNIDGSQATSSAGKDDIFVAQLQSSNGEVAWVKQMGTKEDDSLAHGRGIVCDKDGHAILLGNTRGSFLKEKPPERVGTANDMMLITVDRATGEYMEPIDSNTSFTANESNQIPETPIDSNTSFTANVTQVNEEGSGLKLENEPDVDPFSLQSDSPSDSPDQPTMQVITEYKYKSNDMALIIALILLLQVVVVGLVMLLYIRCKKRGGCRPKRRGGMHFNQRNSNGGSDETGSSSGGANSNSIYHEEEDFDEASFLSGITLRPMPGHGQIGTGRDTLLRLEPTVEPYNINSNRNIFSEERINSYKDAYNSLYADSRCMSTAGAEGSDGDQKERQNVFDDDSTDSEIHSRDSFLDDLLNGISSVSEDQRQSSFDDDSSANESPIRIV